MRIANMTCIVGPAGRRPTSISCAAGIRKSLRANLKLQGAAKRPLPPEKRCVPDFVDERGRRWMIEVENYGCRFAKDDLAMILAGPPGDREAWIPDDLDCWLGSRAITCWVSRPSQNPFSTRPRRFWAFLKPVQTPGTTAATTTVER